MRSQIALTQKDTRSGLTWQWAIGEVPYECDGRGLKEGARWQPPMINDSARRAVQSMLV